MDASATTVGLASGTISAPTGPAIGQVRDGRAAAATGAANAGAGCLRAWSHPKRPELTYAQQCVQAYKTRWQLERDAGASAYRARQSAHARMQYYNAARPADNPEKKG
eukprot:evm.model.scf_556.2 EVM.evm.TU.scf_556.2   scf_556:27653-28457(+)